MRLPTLLPVFALLPLAACVNTDAAIFVDPSISGPAATVSSSALGTGITGGAFTLELHLGARAAGPSTVTLGSFSIVDAQQATTIVPTLDTTSDVTFPATVQPDSTADAHFTFGTGTTLLPAGAASQLCAAAGVVISGTIEDSLAGRQIPVQSAVFHPSGCP